jgi:fibronectin-binding autotransporter adhesin
VAIFAIQLSSIFDNLYNNSDISFQLQILSSEFKLTLISSYSKTSVFEELPHTPTKNPNMNTPRKHFSGSAESADNLIPSSQHRETRQPSHSGRRWAAIRIVGAVAVASLLSHSANAANGTWSGGGVGGNWTTTANWANNTVAGSVNIATDNSTATFNNNTNTTVSLTDIRTVSGVTFGDSAGAFTIQSVGAGELDLVSSNATTSAPGILQTTGNLTNAITISAGVKVRGGTGTYTFLSNAGNSSATLTFSGNVSTGANSGFILDGSNTGNNTISGVLSSGSGFTKNGTGLWILSGNNTYSAFTQINAGILNIQNGNALGTTGQGTTVANGGTLQIQGDITVGAEGLTITGAGAASAKGALENVSGTNNYGGLVLLGGNATIASDAGTLNLTNSGTMTGNAFALTLTGAGNGSIASVIGTTSGTVTKTGSGTWILSGNSTYTGNTTVQAGGLVAGTNSAVSTNGAFGNATSAIALGNANTLSSDAPSLLINGNYTVGRNISVGSVANVNAYNATIGGGNTSGTSTYTGNITLNTAASNYTVTLQAATGGTVEFKTGTWTTNNKAIAVGSSGNAGTVEISNSLTTSGGVNVTSGTLLISSTGSVTSNVTVQSGGSIGGAGTIVGNLVLNASSNFVFSLTQTLTVNTGSVSFGAGGFGVANLFGLDNSAPDATYHLINGNGTINTANLNNLGSGNATTLPGGGKSAYFQTAAGTLDLVVIPEPATWALLAFSLTTVMVLRRRRE